MQTPVLGTAAPSQDFEAGLPQPAFEAGRLADTRGTYGLRNRLVPFTITRVTAEHGRAPGTPVALFAGRRHVPAGELCIIKPECVKLPEDGGELRAYGIIARVEMEGGVQYALEIRDNMLVAMVKATE